MPKRPPDPTPRPPNPKPGVYLVFESSRRTAVWRLDPRFERAALIRAVREHNDRDAKGRVTAHVFEPYELVDHFAARGEDVESVTGVLRVVDESGDATLGDALEMLAGCKDGMKRPPSSCDQ